MTKFKLRKMTVAGVMALGIVVILSAVNASASTVYSGKNGLGVGFDIYYEGYDDTLNINTTDPIFYTDTKNAKTKLPSADKWLRAEYSRGYRKIDLSSYSKETVIYIANSTSAKSEDILAVTIPTKPTLKVELDNATAPIPTEGAFKFTTTFVTTKKGNKDGQYIYESKKYEILKTNNIGVKRSTESGWKSIYVCFYDFTLSQLQNKGTTLQFILLGFGGPIIEMSPEELAASKAIATTGAITSEIPRYKMEGIKVNTGETIGEVSRRSSDIVTVKIAKKANAPVVAIDYDYFLATINKGSYVTLTKEQFSGLDSSNNKVELPKDWTDANRTVITLTQGSVNYIAVKTKEDTSKKKPESKIAYLALGEQPEFDTSNSEADENNDLVIVSSTFDNTGNVKGAELYIKGMQGETYQYCFGKATEILNGDKTQFVPDKTKVKWSKLVNNATKNKAPKVAAKTVTIKNLNGADTILVRKASNKNKGQFASEYIIFTKDGNGWKKSEQDKTVQEVSQIVISTPSAVTYDANNITCELPISVSLSNVRGEVKAKCGKNTVTGSAVANDKKLTVTIPRKADSGLEKENDKLTFTLTIEAGAISDSSYLASNKSVNKIVLDTKAPKVTKVSASAGKKKIIITLDEKIQEIDNTAVSAITVSGKAVSGFTAKVVNKNIEIEKVDFAKNDDIKVQLDFSKIKDSYGNIASYKAGLTGVDTVSQGAIVFKAVK